MMKKIKDLMFWRKDESAKNALSRTKSSPKNVSYVAAPSSVCGVLQVKDDLATHGTGYAVVVDGLLDLRTVSPDRSAALGGCLLVRGLMLHMGDEVKHKRMDEFLHHFVPNAKIVQVEVNVIEGQANTSKSPSA